MTNIDKTVLVTGSSRGIGKAIALYLAKNGYSIVLHCSSNVDRLNELKSEIEKYNVNCRAIAFDVKDRKQAQEVLLADIEANGIYYGVVVNAGITRDNMFPLMKDEEWDDVLDINLGGFYNVLRPLAFPMAQARIGRIVTMASISGMTGNKGQVNYSASKAGLIGASKSLARELARRNITVNCIAPGLIESDMTQNLSDDYLELIPLRRIGTPKEIASLVNYLMSEDAGYITGQVISVNGGFLM